MACSAAHAPHSVVNNVPSYFHVTQQ